MSIGDTVTEAFTLATSATGTLALVIETKGRGVTRRTMTEVHSNLIRAAALIESTLTPTPDNDTTTPPRRVRRTIVPPS